MPRKAMKPKGLPVTKRPATAPMMPNGTVNRMTKGWMKELNCSARMP